MKTSSQLIELSLCLVCALAPLSLLTLKATPTDPPPSDRIRPGDRESVQGNVSAKSNSSLTVNGKAITTTAGTSFMEKGKPITLGRVRTGDTVKINAAKKDDGSLEAVSVEVLAKELAESLARM